MNFQGTKKTKTYKQINNALPETVFPLLCPVREKDWLDGWDYTMIFSKSELIEKGCVFTTPHHGKEPTIWYVTQHDPQLYKVEFVRFTPGVEVVKLNIHLESNSNGTTTATITYEYTALNETRKEWLKIHLDQEFEENMKWWEKSINYYIEKGEKLIK